MLFDFDPRCGRCHADTEGIGGATPLCSCSSRSRSRAAMNRVCKPSYSSSRAGRFITQAPQGLDEFTLRSEKSLRSSNTLFCQLKKFGYISRHGRHTTQSGRLRTSDVPGLPMSEFSVFLRRYHEFTVRSARSQDGLLSERQRRGSLSDIA